MELKNLSCRGKNSKLEELLLDPSAASAAARACLENCPDCRQELEDLRATLALLDGWELPEPSPYFLTRLNARLREEREAAPSGWLQGAMARLHAHFVDRPQIHYYPLAAMALTVVLLLGGGTYLDLTNWEQPPATPEQAAVVHDLQTMDNNAQLLDQLEVISSSDQNGN
ncbi:MAG: hypothetical protein ACP5FH_09040 [Terracidiphilus sp.]